jgi:malate synthase
MSVNVIDPWSEEFVSGLIKEFSEDWAWLLSKRAERRRDPRGILAAIEEMSIPEVVKNLNWMVSRPPLDLIDRRVEITGPGVDPKMMITAANSGACGYMVDGEDSLCPTWENVLETQKNLWGLVRGTLRVERDGKIYALNANRPTLHYRPRGLHMVERRWKKGIEVPACLVDAGLFLYHNAAELVACGSGAYMYLPKLETEQEAMFWDRVAGWVERRLNLVKGSIRFTVLVETLPGLMRLEPIVWTLRERLVGLNVGRWDYMFSSIKCMPVGGSVYPDRKWLTMEAPALVEYARWVIEVAHRRGAHAIGGMAAQVPSRKDPVAAAAACEAVKRDKEREVVMGHDGTWVAHPDLVSIAMGVFRDYLGDRVEQKFVRTGRDVLNRGVVLGSITGGVSREGVVEACRVALMYMDAWLGGNGCVAIDGKMEDAATAEISRMLLWHWVDRGVVSVEEVEEVLRAEWASLVDAGSRPRESTLELLKNCLTSKFEFITEPGYNLIEKRE